MMGYQSTEASMLTPELKEKFLTLACQLSPENLSCDGEAPMSYVRKRAKQLNAQWAELEKQAGRKITEDEIYNYDERVKAYDATHMRVSRDQI
jgi:hypothetical protein